jgi:hypothetical protein
MKRTELYGRAENNNDGKEHGTRQESDTPSKKDLNQKGNDRLQSESVSKVAIESQSHKGVLLRRDLYNITVSSPSTSNIRVDLPVLKT